MRRVAIFAAGSLLSVAVLLSQETPKLKPEVSLSIRELQLQRSENQTKMLVMQQQYQQAQEVVNNLDVQITKKLSTALKDSGLDPDKYDVDSKTLTVHARPASGGVKQ